MRIEAVDFFYLAMPEVTDEADGSQDALLVRVAAGGHTGWGECEAAPLPSIAAFVCPKSHGVCRPVGDSVLGKLLRDPADIARMSAEVAYNSMDLLQAAHTWSGVEIALWDLLGKARGEPVWKMLGYAKSSSEDALRFGAVRRHAGRNTRASTRHRARKISAPRSSAGARSDAARPRRTPSISPPRAKGSARTRILLVDTGQIFIDDVERAAQRLPALEQARATWFEEPFAASALAAYGALAQRSRQVKLAGGEGAHNVDMAKHLIDYGGVGYIQIDCGRIGGIGPSKQVADYAVAKGVTFVNHTFTSHLALSASMQPYAGLEDHRICEFPAMPKPLALELSQNHLQPDRNGEIAAPDAPGLGIEVSPAGVRKYLQEVDIQVNGRTLFSTPKI